MTEFLLLVHAALLAACVIPLGLPPTRTDVGHSWQKSSSGTRVAVGLDLGSVVAPKDLPVEAGGGLVFDFLSSADDPMTSTTSGQYADAGIAVHRTDHTRVLAGARYEHFASGVFQHALALRLDLEAVGHVASTFADGDSSGLVVGGGYGNFGIGLYAEAGPAWTPEDTRGWTATAGVSLRMPAWAAVALLVPHHGSSGRVGSSGSEGSVGSYGRH